MAELLRVPSLADFFHTESKVSAEPLSVPAAAVGSTGFVLGCYNCVVVRGRLAASPQDVAAAPGVVADSNDFDFRCCAAVPAAAVD